MLGVESVVLHAILQRYDKLMFGFEEVSGSPQEARTVPFLQHRFDFVFNTLLQKLGTTSQVSGITLSQEQVRRAKELAEEQDVTNAEFQVMDALHMSYPVGCCMH